MSNKQLMMLAGR